MRLWRWFTAGGAVSGGMGPLLLAVFVPFLMGFVEGNRSASAFPIKTGNDDLRVNWDNTVRYNFGLRVKGQDPGLLKNPNIDDGNRNFPNGTVTNRVDLLSELDAVYKRDFGLRASGAFWYEVQ